MTVKRADVPIPAGWKVRPNSSVQVLDHDKLTPAGMSVAGLWRVLDRSPEGWWIFTADDTARTWYAIHGRNVASESGMIQVHAQRLVPGWIQLPVPGVR